MAVRSALLAAGMKPLARALSGTQTFEKGPRPDQIGSSEALCESVVYRLQKIMSLTNAALLAPEACKTRRRSQFPREGTLLTRGAQGLLQ